MTIPAKITFDGITLTVPQWAKRLGFERSALYKRFNDVSVEEALTRPKYASRTEDEHKAWTERIVQQTVAAKTAKRLAARQQIEAEAIAAGVNLETEGWSASTPIPMLTDEKAWELYFDKGWTQEWIASRYSLTVGAVRFRLIKHPDYEAVAKQRHAAHLAGFGERGARTKANAAIRYEHAGENLTIKEWSIKTGFSTETIAGRLRRGWSIEETLTTPSEELAHYEYNGMNLTVSQWSEQTGLSANVINDRLRRGWTVDKTLTTPVADVYEYEGETLTVPEWAEKTGLSQSTIYGRIKLGWSISDTLTLPVVHNMVKHAMRYAFAGKNLTLQEWAVERGMSVHTLRARIRLKWSIEDALTTPVAHKTTRST